MAGDDPREQMFCSVCDQPCGSQGHVVCQKTLDSLNAHCQGVVCGDSRHIRDRRWLCTCSCAKCFGASGEVVRGPAVPAIHCEGLPLCRWNEPDGKCACSCMHCESAVKYERIGRRPIMGVMWAHRGESAAAPPPKFDSRESEIREAKDDLANQAHNVATAWAHLRCDNSQMLLPLKFVEEMMELDRRVDRLSAIQRDVDDAKTKAMS